MTGLSQGSSKLTLCLWESLVLSHRTVLDSTGGVAASLTAAHQITDVLPFLHATVKTVCRHCHLSPGAGKKKTGPALCFLLSGLFKLQATQLSGPSISDTEASCSEMLI